MNYKFPTLRTESNDDEIITTEDSDEGMTPRTPGDTHANDSLEEMSHQCPTLRTEANDDEIIATEASDGGIPPPPEDTHASDKRDSLAVSKTSTKRGKLL